MKGKYLIAIAFLASWTVITANDLADIFGIYDEDCPSPDTCPPKLISHEVDCTKFYECKYSSKQLRSCPAGLYFSLRWRGCVSRPKSDCPDLPTNPTIPTIPTPPVTIPHGDCEINGELLAHECKCGKFYECKNGRKALRDCQPGQGFNPTTKTCETGYDCKGPQPTTPPPICREGENIAHECQCTKYYLCKGGRKALRECDKGWHFDKTSLVCVPGGDCGIKPICTEGVKKRHECNYCDRYYNCVYGDWVLEFCNGGLHFNETYQKCMDPLEAGCDPTLRPKPGDCSSSSPSRWAHECDCRLYYQCENRIKKLYDCSWGFYFNDENLNCDVAANVKAKCKNSWDNWL